MKLDKEIDIPFTNGDAWIELQCESSEKRTWLSFSFKTLEPDDSLEGNIEWFCVDVLLPSHFDSAKK